MSETPQDKHAEGIKSSIESMLGSNTLLKRRRKTEDDVMREKFEFIIKTLEKVSVRSELAASELNLNLFDYDAEFYKVIDNLIELTFGIDVAELIYFYVYDRVTPDGNIQTLVDMDGKPIILNSPTDLWDLILQIHEQGNKKKK